MFFGDEVGIRLGIGDVVLCFPSHITFALEILDLRLAIFAQI